MVLIKLEKFEVEDTTYKTSQPDYSDSSVNL